MTWNVRQWDKSSALVLETCILAIECSSDDTGRSHPLTNKRKNKFLSWVLNCWFFCMYGKLLHPSKSHARRTKCVMERSTCNFHSYWLSKETRGISEFSKGPYHVRFLNTSQKKLSLDLFLKLCLYRIDYLWIYHKNLWFESILLCVKPWSLFTIHKIKIFL